MALEVFSNLNILFQPKYSLKSRNTPLSSLENQGFVTLAVGGSHHSQQGREGPGLGPWGISGCKSRMKRVQSNPKMKDPEMKVFQ